MKQNDNTTEAITVADDRPNDGSWWCFKDQHVLVSSLKPRDNYYPRGMKMQFGELYYEMDEYPKATRESKLHHWLKQRYHFFFWNEFDTLPVRKYWLDRV